MTRRKLLTTFTAASLRAQDQPTFSAGVKVVSVLATVRTKKGQILRDLDRDEFSILENGHPQEIRYFSRESDLPLTIGLMVDTSMSQRRVLEQERAASFRFLDQVLRENKDRVFIMQFDMAVQLKQGLTNSRRELEDALSLVDTPTRQELSVQNGGGTLLYDAVIQASRDSMAMRAGRKALIVLSDGVDIGSEANLALAVDAAQRADTLVYSILFSDDMAYGAIGALLGGSEGRNALSRLSRETGGGFYEGSKKKGIEAVFDEIQNELRSQYSLGFVSSEPVTVSEFRKLRLDVKRKGAVVQTREKYWAQR